MKTPATVSSALCLAALLAAAPRSHAAVAAAGVVPIDAYATSGDILEQTGRVDLALNLGHTAGGVVGGITFTGARLTVGTAVVGSGATLTPDAPTPAATSLRNLSGLNGYLWPVNGAFGPVLNDLIDSNRYPAQPGDALNFTISGLDPNRFYFVQVLSGDTRAEFENQRYTLGTTSQDANFGDGGANDGALVKFTATGETTLALSIANVTGASPPMVGGILIRSVEPGIFAPASASATSNGTPSTLNVSVGNASSATYSVTGVSFSGPDAGIFSTSTTLPLEIPATGAANVVVNVAPTSGGTKTATMTIATNDPAAPSIDIPLTVSVRDPVVTAETEVDFGASPGQSTSITDVVFVENDGGSSNLVLSSAVISGPGASAFSVVSLPAPIAADGFDTIEVAFNPTAPGYYTAQLEVATNDPFKPSIIVQLKGELTGDLIFPMTVAGFSSQLTLWDTRRFAANTANGSGMTGLGSPGSSHGIGENGVVWTTGGIYQGPDYAPQITYDLGGLYEVKRIREWGYNDSYSAFGPKSVEVFTSSDNFTFTSAGLVEFAKAPGTPGYTGNEIPVNLPRARYIRLVIKSNQDGAIFDGSGAVPGVDGRNLTGLSEVRFEGTYIPPVPGLSAAPLASTISNGAPSDLTVTVTNAGYSNYSITGAAFSGPDAAIFSLGSTLPLEVPADGTADLTVTVTPTSGGTKNATLTLTTNDPLVPTVTVTLAAEVRDPVVDIATELNFGAKVGQTASATELIQVGNDGGALNLTVSSAVITGPGAAAFSVTSLPDPVAAGAVGEIGITFNPQAPGYYAAQLEVTTNDPFKPSVKVNLKGELTGNLIYPMTVVGASSELTEWGVARDAANSANGNGMTGLGSPGSVHSTGENGLVWTTDGTIAGNDLSPQITYDLGAVYQVNRIREWGYNDPTINLVLGTPASIFGPKSVEVLTSTDNVNFTSAGLVEFAQAPGTAGYTGHDIPVSLPAARYIRLAIKGNYDGAIFDGTGANPGLADKRNLTGLSEVRFEGTPVAGSPFDTWLDVHGLTGADRGPNADPDQDGMTNLLEYAIGGNPLAADSAKLPAATTQGDNLVLSFTRPTAVAGVSLRFEAGTDLVTWPDTFAVGSSAEVTVTPGQNGGEVVTLTLPKAGKPLRFVRLVASSTP